MNKHKETRLEDAVISHLIKEGGYIQGNSKDFEPTVALEPVRIIQFIKDTQPQLWKALEAIHGVNTEKVIIDSLCKELEIKGVLKVLRYGFKCYGRKVKIAVFAPNNKMNPDTLDLYNKKI